MNKSDVILVVIVLTISAFIIGIFYFNQSDGEVFEVFYEDELVLTGDLKTDKEYTVEGYLGEVVIEVKGGKVRVKKENSPRHICSKEGYISSSNRTLVCLPNKITIKIRGANDLDGVVY